MGLLLLMSAAPLVAQGIWGEVVDVRGEALAFVSIRLNDQSAEGVLTDIHGRFEVPADREVRSLTFSYVGYARQRIAMDTWPAGPLRVVLLPDAVGLPEIVVRAGENPALRIIREATARRERHNPEQYGAFSCLIYNKISLDPLFDDALLLSADSVEATPSRLDTFRREMEGRHLFFMESVVERRYRKPGQVQDIVQHNRVSGLQEARILALANALQPFSFYGDHIQVLETSYLSPLARVSAEQYRYRLMDTLFQGRDTVWVIQFQPRPGARFDGLEGVLHIHGVDYALRNVLARPAGERRITMNLEQQYQRLADGRWFPEQLQFELRMPRYPDPQMGVVVRGRSFLQQITLDPPLRRKDFDPQQPLYVLPGAYERDEAVWADYRPPGGLAAIELETYHFMDSLGLVLGLDRLTRWQDVLGTGVLAVHKASPVHLDLRRILDVNEYEGVRLGLGLTTRSPVALLPPRRRLEASAWAGYGFRDRGWKYGGQLEGWLHRPTRTLLRARYQHDLGDPGSLYEWPAQQWLSRRFYATRMDREESLALELESLPWPDLLLRVGYHDQRVRPGYTYQFTEAGGEPRDAFHFQEWRVAFRFARYARGRGLQGQPLDRKSRIPVWEGSYTRSLAGIWTAQPAYQRLVTALHQEVMVPGRGLLRWRLEAGQAWGELPVSRLFTVIRPPESSYRWLLIPQVMQTTRSPFLYDRFVNLYISQELGAILWQHRYSRPVPTLVQHGSIGGLREPERHAGWDFRTPVRGFAETGLVLQRLLLVNYVNIADLAFGAGVFMPYGPGIRNSAAQMAPRITWWLAF